MLYRITDYLLRTLMFLCGATCVLLGAWVVMTSPDLPSILGALGACAYGAYIALEGIYGSAS